MWGQTEVFPHPFTWQKGTDLIPIVRVWFKRLAIGLGLILATIFAVRAWDAWRAPPLKLWHTEVPTELSPREMEDADWERWLTAEDAVFAQVEAEVTDKLPAEDRVAANRYFAGSPMYERNSTRNWNRSFVLSPEGPPRGAVVLLHGLTDAPYSLRHVANRYRAAGFVAVGIRLPGHGTVPGALTTVREQDWFAATRLAVRTARGLSKDGPLHIVGYSNGGALALQYAIEALGDSELASPDQLVLISPMIGITSMARFAGVLGWPAVFPSFAKAAWLDVLPEYNPYKYNSFPVNAARQSSQVANGIRDRLNGLAKQGRLVELPPILTFQSVLDTTVHTRAVIDTLYVHLPRNGSELVLFDRNHSARVDRLIRPQNADVPATLLPPAPRNYAVTLVTNSGVEAGQVQARTTAAGSSSPVVQPLDASYPLDFISLSHVALPFPLDDGLYGTHPDPSDDFGVQLGNLSVRGERNALVINADGLMRASANPFFDYLLARIDATLPRSDERGIEKHHQDEAADQ